MPAPLPSWPSDSQTTTKSPLSRVVIAVALWVPVVVALTRNSLPTSVPLEL